MHDYLSMPDILTRAENPPPQVHTCHWPGCNRRVPPRLWGCKAHWYKLPKYLRDAIWREYRPGQEISKTPSRAYLDVAKQVQEWIAAHGF